MYYITNYASPVGELTLVSEGTHLVGLWIEGQKYHGASLLSPLSEVEPGGKELSIFSQTKEWLDRYFQGKKPDPAQLSLSPIGSAFRQRVWQHLRNIPYGELTSYGAIAKKIALEFGKKSMSGQAVGGAVGHNPISIIIPCHRVVGTNGSLTGYAGGLDVKIKLLALEGVDLSDLSIPANGTAL